MRLPQPAPLIEGGEFQVLGFDAQAGRDVVADEVEPGEVFGRELDSGLSLVHAPLVEACGDGFSEGFEHGLLFQRKADEGDEVSETSRL